MRGFRPGSSWLGVAAALLAAGQTAMPRLTGGSSPKRAVPARRGSHTRRGTYEAGINANKRKIPKQRKHRVRLRAHMRGVELRRPLTPYERGWL